MREFIYSPARLDRELGDSRENSVVSRCVVTSVGSILQAVRARGDEALLEYSEKYDRVSLASAQLRITDREFAQALGGVKAADRRAIRGAIHCVEDFHRNGIPKAWNEKNPHGASVGERYYPLRRVGIYIPSGEAPLVSTVVMTATLARLAKVDEIVMCTPPKPDGSVNSGLLATMHLSGVREVYRLGSAWAIGAMAYGTETVQAVDKIFGPGPVHVVEAKRQVFGAVGIDLLPGPSEVMVIADGGAQAAFVAADMLAQAEHGSGLERVFLVSPDTRLIEDAKNEIARQLPSCSHGEAIAKVLGHNCFLIRVSNFKEAVEVANTVAPEHLELQVDMKTARLLTRNIYTAGAIFIGHATPAVLGDFTAGPSHVLPTGGTGRFNSGLRVTDFCRRSSVVQYGSRSLTKARSIVAAFSRLEGLDAHGRSLEIRFDA